MAKKTKKKTNTKKPSTSIVPLGGKKKTKAKKNILKTPQRILMKLESLKGDEVEVGILRTYSLEDLRAGILDHLNITYSDSEGLHIPDEVIPSSVQGKYSKKNIEGYEIIRRDLGKQTVGYRTMEAPNWGGYGTHEVNSPIKGFLREHISPTDFSITLECPDISSGKKFYAIKFVVNSILDKNDVNFGDELLYCLNILQENIGACGVEKAATQLSDYRNTLRVNWEILPPDNIDEALKMIFKGRKPSTKQIKDTKERMSFFYSLEPQDTIVGSSGFGRYIGAKINDNLVVFENVVYGNAIYIMFEDWKKLSQRTRLELMSGVHGQNFERVIHNDGWQAKVTRIVEEHR